MTDKIDIMIPAAGNSTRMKEVSEGSKLLLKIDGTTIITHAILEALHSKDAGNIHVVVKKDSAVERYLMKSKYKGEFYIHYQDEPLGVMDACLKAKKYINTKFFGIIFPDLIIKNNLGISAMQQTIDAFKIVGKPTFGIIAVLPQDRIVAGKCSTVTIKDDYLGFRITKTHKGRMKHSRNLAICREILPTGILNNLKKNVNDEYDDSILFKTLIKNKLYAIFIDGRYFDVGIPSGYYHAKKELEERT